MSQSIAFIERNYQVSQTLIQITRIPEWRIVSGLGNIPTNHYAIRYMSKMIFSNLSIRNEGCGRICSTVLRSNSSGQHCATFIGADASFIVGVTKNSANIYLPNIVLEHWRLKKPLCWTAYYCWATVSAICYQYCGVMTNAALLPNAAPVSTFYNIRVFVVFFFLSSGITTPKERNKTYDVERLDSVDVSFALYLHLFLHLLLLFQRNYWTLSRAILCIVILAFRLFLLSQSHRFIFHSFSLHFAVRFTFISSPITVLTNEHTRTREWKIAPNIWSFSLHIYTIPFLWHILFFLSLSLPHTRTFCSSILFFFYKLFVDRWIL